MGHRYLGIQQQKENFLHQYYHDQRYLCDRGLNFLIGRTFLNDSLEPILRQIFQIKGHYEFLNYSFLFQVRV